MPLTNTKISAAKPKAKIYRLYDEKGLYLEVTPAGGRYWRLKYRVNGREKRLAIGVYPDVSLAQAREQRAEARSLLAADIDPSAARQAAKIALAGSDSLEAIGREWLAVQEKELAANTLAKTSWMLESFIFPRLGALHPNEVTPPLLLSALRSIEHRGRYETAHRTKQTAGRLFRYAIATGRCERDPSADLKGALTAPQPIHRAAITEPREIGALLRALDGFRGHYVTSCALRLAPLVFVRPGELRAATWREFDLESAEWRIAAERTKMRAAHIVPLARQAIHILEEIKPLTDRSEFVFPSIRTASRPMSANTMNAALRRLGYTKDEMTAHGFRAMASTRLNEMGWKPDVIERQLAHVERNKVRAAYNRAQHLEERREMMQAWADYLDALKVGAPVVPLRGKKRMKRGNK